MLRINAFPAHAQKKAVTCSCYNHIEGNQEGKREGKRRIMAYSTLFKKGILILMAFNIFSQVVAENYTAESGK